LDWEILSQNPRALPLLEKNMDKVNWALLSLNPKAGHIFQNHPDRAHTYREWLSQNPSIFEYDYVKTYQKACHFSHIININQK
jgi:hypothetical protein